jgi:tetratricopeptide (TPR) repeat protein
LSLICYHAELKRSINGLTLSELWKTSSALLHIRVSTTIRVVSYRAFILLVSLAIFGNCSSALEQVKPPSRTPFVPHLGVSLEPSVAAKGSPNLNLDKLLQSVDGYLAQGAFLRAESLLSSALKDHPRDFRLNLEKARVLRSMGHFASARDMFLALRAQEPTAVEPLINLSQMSLENLAMDDALKYARQAVGLSPGSKSACSALAAALIDNNLLPEANNELVKIQNKFGVSPEFYYLRYQMFSREEKSDQALAALERAVQLSQSNSLWLMDLSTLYRQAGNYDASLETINRYLLLNPGSIEALSKVAALYEFNFHNYDRAILAYKQILQIDPDIVDAEVGIDRCKQKDNDLAAAIKDQLWKFLRKSNTFQDVSKQPGNRNAPAHNTLDRGS